MPSDKSIFKQGSTTYYWSSKFFPKNVRRDVFKLYSFVRVADDYVDAIPSNKKVFKKLVSLHKQSISDETFDTEVLPTDTINQQVVKNIVAVSHKYSFEPEWVDSFLDSMQADLDQRQYEKLEDSLWYVYGSAEVIGLMMSKIMGLPPRAYEAAKMQGRAMQWINFIRDIDEDNQLGRMYFPLHELETFGLKDLSKKTAQANPQAFKDFMLYQIARYNEWQTEANDGYQFIPKRLRLPLMTARDMYSWTAQQIAKDPLIIYDKKIKPSKKRVIFRAISIIN